MRLSCDRPVLRSGLSQLNLFFFALDLLTKACYAEMVPKSWGIVGNVYGLMYSAHSEITPGCLYRKGDRPWVCCGLCPVKVTSGSCGITTKRTQTILKPWRQSVRPSAFLTRNARAEPPLSKSSLVKLQGVLSVLKPSTAPPSKSSWSPALLAAKEK